MAGGVRRALCVCIALRWHRWTRCGGLAGGGVQACETPGYSLPVADATVGRMRILLAESRQGFEVEVWPRNTLSRSSATSPKLRNCGNGRESSSRKFVAWRIALCQMRSSEDEATGNPETGSLGWTPRSHVLPGYLRTATESLFLRRASIRPLENRVQCRAEGLAPCRQSVLHLGRDLWIWRPLHEAVRLQALQLLP